MTKDLQAWVLLVMAGAIVAGLTLWRMGLMPHAQAPLVFAPALQTEPAAAPPQPRIEYPLGATLPATPLAGEALRRALADLLGGEAALSFLQLEDFPRRVVATIDNLARSHAPSQLWPVDPTTDRFTVDERAEAPVIASDNAGRYTPFVLLTEAVDARRAVDLYLRLYPLLQKAYEELGFPGHYFNDRLMTVIDLLLATPETELPLKLRLTEVEGRSFRCVPGSVTSSRIRRWKRFHPGRKSCCGSGRSTSGASRKNWPRFAANWPAASSSADLAMSSLELDHSSEPGLR